jgi:hypothetical protein
MRDTQAAQVKALVGRIELVKSANQIAATKQMVVFTLPASRIGLACFRCMSNNWASARSYLICLK